MCLEQIELLDDPLVEVRVTMAGTRILGGVIPPVGASLAGLVQPGDVVERIG